MGGICAKTEDAALALPCEQAEYIQPWPDQPASCNRLTATTAGPVSGGVDHKEFKL